MMGKLQVEAAGAAAERPAARPAGPAGQRKQRRKLPAPAKPARYAKFAAKAGPKKRAAAAAAAAADGDGGQRSDDDDDCGDFVEVDDKRAHAERMLALERCTPRLISKDLWPVDEKLKLGEAFACRVDCEAMAMAYAEQKRMLLKRNCRSATFLRYGCKMCDDFTLCFLAKDMGEMIGDDGAFTSRDVVCNPLALFLLTFR